VADGQRDLEAAYMGRGGGGPAVTRRLAVDAQQERVVAFPQAALNLGLVEVVDPGQQLGRRARVELDRATGSGLDRRQRPATAPAVEGAAGLVKLGAVGALDRDTPCTSRRPTHADAQSAV
jgi:hypothetical protein